MRLSQFIRHNQKAITIEWIEFAKTASPASRHMTVAELRDHINEILTFIENDIETPQTEKQQIIKSQAINLSNTQKGIVPRRRITCQHYQIIPEYRGRIECCEGQR